MLVVDLVDEAEEVEDVEDGCCAAARVVSVQREGGEGGGKVRGEAQAGERRRRPQEGEIDRARIQLDSGELLAVLVIAPVRRTGPCCWVIEYCGTF